MEALAAKKAPVTNMYYPGPILRKNEISEPNYFMHNGPLPHIAASLGGAEKTYSSWILINLISHWVVAWVIFLIAKKYSNLRIANWSAAFYLLSPIAIWQSINMLQEQFYAGLLAISILGIIFHDRLLAHSITVAALITGILSHPIFLIIALIHATVIISTGLSKKSYKQALLGLFLAVVYLIIKKYTNLQFPSSFQPNLSAIIQGSVPRVSNMMWHYSDAQVPIDFSLIKNKISFAASEHFFRLKNAPIYLFTNIALFSYVYLLLLKRKNYHWTLWITLGAVFGCYLAILTLMQTQARYQQIISVVSFISIALACHQLASKIHLSPKLLSIARSAALLTTLGISLFMAHSAHRQGSLEAVAMSQLTDRFSTLAEDARILILDSEHELKLGYILKPRKVLAVRSSFIEESSYSKSIELFEPTHAISTREIPLTSSAFENYPPIENVNSEYLGDFYIRQLK